MREVQIPDMCITGYRSSVQVGTQGGLMRNPTGKVGKFYSGLGHTSFLRWLGWVRDCDGTNGGIFRFGFVLMLELQLLKLGIIVPAVSHTC